MFPPFGIETETALSQGCSVSPRGVRNLAASVRQRLFNLARSHGRGVWEGLFGPQSFDRVVKKQSPMPHKELNRGDGRFPRLGAAYGGISTLNRTRPTELSVILVNYTIAAAGRLGASRRTEQLPIRLT